MLVSLFISLFIYLFVTIQVIELLTQLKNWFLLHIKLVVALLQNAMSIYLYSFQSTNTKQWWDSLSLLLRNKCKININRMDIIWSKRIIIFLAWIMKFSFVKEITIKFTYSSCLISRHMIQYIWYYRVFQSNKTAVSCLVQTENIDGAFIKAFFISAVYIFCSICYCQIWMFHLFK